MGENVGLQRKDIATFIGIDLHKDSLTWCARDASGEELRVGRISTKCRDKIVSCVTDWPRPISVTIESVGFYRWLWLLLEPEVDKLVLADARRLRAMADTRTKTDFKDARLSSKVLWRGEIPTSFAIGEPLYSLRQNLRHRHDLARRAARVKSSLRRISLRNNVPGPRTITGARAVSYFDAFGYLFNSSDAHRWHDLTDQLILLERQLARAERESHLAMEAVPQIHESIRRLDTAPGIGELSAATVLLETGGLVRFTHPEQAACFSGLTPRVFQSGDTVRHGRISKEGPPNLRWILQQAAWCAIRTCPEVRAIHNRIARRAGRKKAAAAIARKLIVWLWAMETYQTDWNPELRRVGCSRMIRATA